MEEENTLLEDPKIFPFQKKTTVNMEIRAITEVCDIERIGGKKKQFGNNIHFQGSKYVIPRTVQSRDWAHNGV